MLLFRVGIGRRYGHVGVVGELVTEELELFEERVLFWLVTGQKEIVVGEHQYLLVEECGH